MDCNDAIFTIVTSIICSVIASYVFWTLSFKVSTTKIIFSHHIEKSLREGRYKLRIRMVNTGPADLFDVRFVARLMYKPRMKGERQSRATAVYLNFGHQSMLPILYGKQKQKKHPTAVLSWTSVLEESDDFYSEFSKQHHTDAIRAKALNKTLTVDDVIVEYSENSHIRIFAFGTDSMTGIEKMFLSPRYTANDLIIGRFNTPNKKFKWYRNYINYIMDIIETVNNSV